jgi:hypothetical protein
MPHPPSTLIIRPSVSCIRIGLGRHLVQGVEGITKRRPTDWSGGSAPTGGSYGRDVATK